MKITPHPRRVPPDQRRSSHTRTWPTRYNSRSNRNQCSARSLAKSTFRGWERWRMMSTHPLNSNTSRSRIQSRLIQYRYTTQQRTSLTHTRSPLKSTRRIHSASHPHSHPQRAQGYPWSPLGRGSEFRMSKNKFLRRLIFKPKKMEIILSLVILSEAPLIIRYQVTAAITRTRLRTWTSWSAWQSSRACRERSTRCSTLSPLWVPLTRHSILNNLRNRQQIWKNKCSSIHSALQLASQITIQTTKWLLKGSSRTQMTQSMLWEWHRSSTSRKTRARLRFHLNPSSLSKKRSGSALSTSSINNKWNLRKPRTASVETLVWMLNPGLESSRSYPWQLLEYERATLIQHLAIALQESIN